MWQTWPSRRGRIERDQHRHDGCCGQHDYSGRRRSSGRSDDQCYRSPNSSLVVTSEGTAEDALTISTTAGGINITNAGAAAGEDLDLSSTNASINLTAAEAATDAITLAASAGGMTMTALDDIAVTLTSGGAGEDISLTKAERMIQAFCSRPRARA